MLTHEWTRQDWIHKYDKRDRQQYAKTNPLAWTLEYEPEIRVPSKGYIPFKPYYAQQVLLNARDRFRHLNKSRQLGFTTDFAVESAHDLIYTPSAEVIVLSKSEKEAKKFLDKFYVAYNSVEGKDPNWKPLAIQNKFDAATEDGSTINVLTSSRGAGRSFSGTRLYFDEMAHTMYADDIYDASLPTVSVTGGAVTLFSSPKGKGNKFSDIGHNLDDNGFVGFQWEWWFSPIYNPHYDEFMTAYFKKDHLGMEKAIAKAKTGAWYKQMRKKYSDLAWAQEYECSYDADVDSVFNARQLRKAFKGNYLDDYTDPIAEESFSSPVQEGHHYVTGVDLGRKRDATVIVTFDVTEIPAKLVEFKRIPPATADWGLIELAVRDTHDKFKSEMVHDATGAGDPISELLIDISEPFVITGGGASKAKYHIIENLRRACDREAIIMPKIKRIFREFENYKWNDKAIVQDCVMAIALATYQFYEPEAVWTGAIDINYAEVEI